jgi:hypothetical protein
VKIEFGVIGDGTNVQVSLLEDLGGVEVVADRLYTADHQGGIHYGEDRKVPISARGLFAWVDGSWADPIIGGRYASAHPYWAEREAARKRRQQP